MVNQRHQNDNNVTVVLNIVLVFFVLCQILNCVEYTLSTVMPENVQFCGGYGFYLRPVADMLLVLNSAVNFVFYVIFNERFRHVPAQTVGWCSVPEIEGYVRLEDLAV